MFWIVLAGLWKGWRRALVLVHPDTVVRWQRQRFRRCAFAERLIGSIRRECLDHVVVLHERHLRRLLKKYLTYYHGSRTHLGLGKDAPEPRAVMSQ